MSEIQRKPRAPSTAPICSSGRTPVLERSRDEIWAPTMMARAIGKKAKPAFTGPYRGHLEVVGQEVPHGEERAANEEHHEIRRRERSGSENLERHERMRRTFASQNMNAASRANPKKSHSSVVEDVQLCVVVFTTA